MKQKLRHAALWLVGVTTVNAAYLAAFDSPTIFYHANVVAHLALGLLLVVALFVGAFLWIRRGSESVPSRSMRGLIVGSGLAMGATGLWLGVTGTARPFLWILRIHEAFAIVFLAAFLIPRLSRERARWVRATAASILAIAVLLPAGVRGYRMLQPTHVATITNPPLPPMTPYEEGDGKDSPFFPSSNRVRPEGEYIPSDFFLESQSCGNKGCHPDITAQWEESAHHFSSFNNQWYRKSVEYMQSVIGTEPSKWCGGCHDMAILLTGRMDIPVVDQMDAPEVHAGIGCLVCHSIVHVSDTMGQGGFTLEYPDMHKLVASKNPVLEFLHDKMVQLDPGPHSATMLKPFHKTAVAEFCSSCHKVHLDKPVNSYRWFRGFDEYDAWQGSGVSGQGARSFYYPPKPQHCGECHMPLVPSDDQGNINGMVHSHRFPGANTALPVANDDPEQLEIVTKFLQDGILTVDIFAVSEEGEEHGAAQVIPSDAGEEPVADAPATIQSMFPEEGGLAGQFGTAAGPKRDVIAPIDRAGVAARPGSTVRVDVVARTRKIGHFFPGGTIDAFDVWLELKAEDADGKVIFWNGWIADDGSGPVDPSAHFYRSLLVDEHGNRINKRNAWAARALVYARLIPPGAADTAHFRLRLPRDVRGPVKLTARMNYRKFAWWNTQWAFAGVRDPDQGEFSLAPGHDDGRFVFTGDTSGVSGRLKEIPDLPTIVIAEDTKLLRVGNTPSIPESETADRERWNDFGIGLLRQRDFKGAAEAFLKVTELEPGYADGWVNRARVAVQEGDHQTALELLEQALALNPRLASANYFRGIALRSSGRYDEALASLRVAAEQYPRDAVVQNAIGRILFLQRRYPEAVERFKTTLSVNPEDLTAHYNLMLSYRGLKDPESAKVHETLYERFKADESAQFITGAFRRLNPDDNRERQAIHVHDSSFTPENLAAASGENYRKADDSARTGG